MKLMTTLLLTTTTINYKYTMFLKSRNLSLTDPALKGIHNPQLSVNLCT